MTSFGLKEVFMKTRGEDQPKAFKPYTQEDVDLILSLVPTYENKKNLAKSLGRTEKAINLVFKLAYSGRWLKRDLAELGEHQNNVLTKIAVAKKKTRIFVGYKPK
jgi:hypothetical protein